MNHAYPGNDEGSYFLVAEKIYRAFQTGGWWPGIRSFYLVREGHSTLHPAIGGLTLLLTRGSALWAIRLSGVLYLSVLLLFTFESMCLALPVAESAAATALLGLLPWINYSARFFASELPELSCSIAALYFLCRCWKEESGKYALGLGLAAGLAVCFALGPPILFLLLPITAWIGAGYLKKRFSPRDLIACCISWVPFIFFVLRPHDDWPGFIRFGLLVLPALCVTACRDRFKLNRTLSWASASSFLCISLWYAPFLHDLFNWVFNNTYGVMAQQTTQISKAQLMRDIWTELGGYSLLLLAIAGIIGLRKSLFSGSRAWLFILGLGTVVFPELVALTTHNPRTRYYYPSAYLASAIALLFALDPKGARKPLRQGLVVVVAIGCIVWNVQSIWFCSSAKVLSTNPDDDYRALLRAPQALPDPEVPFVDALKAQIAPGLIDAGGIRVQLEPTQERPIPFYFSSDKLSIVARERGMDWNFVSDDDQAADRFIVGPESTSDEGILKEKCIGHRWKRLAEFTAPDRGSPERFLLVSCRSGR